LANVVSLNIWNVITSMAGTQCGSWLRYYAASLKVADMIRDVIGFFSWPNSSSCVISLWSIQSVTEMSTKNLHGVKGGKRVRLTASPLSMSRFVCKMCDPRHLTTLWASTTFYRDSCSCLIVCIYTSLNWFLPFRCSHYVLYALLISLLSNNRTWLVHFVGNLVIFGVEYKLWSPSLCTFLSFAIECKVVPSLINNHVMNAFQSSYWTVHPENVGASTSHKAMGLHGLLQR
jgi:hypothetical protein